MATADEVVIIIIFVFSFLAFAGLLTAVIILWSNFSKGGDKWRQALKENPDTPPVKMNRLIPIMNRQQILDAADTLETAGS